MQVIETNFVERYQSYPLWGKWMLFALAIVMLIFVVSDYQDLQKQLEQQQLAQQVSSKVEKTEVTKKQLASFGALKAVETDLNVPWLALLAELERLKAEHPGLSINSIHPSRETGLLKLTAEVNDFGKVVGFVSNMRASDFFSTVSLVQHEDKQRKKQAVDKAAIEFAIMAQWQANAQ